MKLLKQLIIAITAISLISALTEPWLSSYFHVMTIADWLGLSKTGLSHLYLWQLFTWIFIEPSNLAGISFSYLISLAFYLYFLWIFGSAYITNFGQSSFVRFFASSALFFGIFAAFIILITGSFTPLMGLTPFLLALFTAWTLMNSENEMQLLFFLPIKTKTLLIALAAGTFLVALSKGSLLLFLIYPGAIVWGYLYSVVVLELWSPFTFLNSFENKLHHFRGRLFKGKITVEDASQKIKGKVIDLHTGKPHLDDEEFLEEMLTKISKGGEDSLTWNERRRLEEISKRKNAER